MVSTAEERILCEAPGSDRIAQAYLISAGSETEAERAAEDFLRRLFCETHSGCGRCPGCRKFDERNHVDLFLLEAETTIKKDQIEELDDFLSKKSFEGGYRCIYIKGAHKMNLTVQNKLLKSIEEPPENVVFVLATSEPERLLVTTRSRCVAVRIRAKSRAQIMQALGAKAAGDRLAMIAAQSMGSVAAAEELLQDEGFAERREKASSILEMLIKYRNPSVFKMQELLAEDFPGTAEQMILMLRDAVFVQLTDSREFLMNPDRQPQIEELCARITPAGLSRMANILLEAYEKKVNCQGLGAKLLAETTLFQLMEVRNRCLK